MLSNVQSCHIYITHLSSGAPRSLCQTIWLLWFLNGKGVLHPP